jgi:hypothetical protein
MELLKRLGPVGAVPSVPSATSFREYGVSANTLPEERWEVKEQRMIRLFDKSGEPHAPIEPSPTTVFPDTS